jgi:hypothetical protein
MVRNPLPSRGRKVGRKVGRTRATNTLCFLGLPRARLHLGSARLAGAGPGLQNRCGAVLLSWAGSIPVRFRRAFRVARSLAPPSSPSDSSPESEHPGGGSPRPSRLPSGKHRPLPRGALRDSEHPPRREMRDARHSGQEHETRHRQNELGPAGRKAWLFVGSDDHAEAAANLFSLIASCRLHGLDPKPTPETSSACSSTGRGTVPSSSPRDTRRRRAPDLTNGRSSCLSATSSYRRRSKKSRRGAAFAPTVTRRILRFQGCARQNGSVQRTQVCSIVKIFSTTHALHASFAMGGNAYLPACGSVLGGVTRRRLR